VPGTGSGSMARQDLLVDIYEFSDSIYIFIINIRNVVDAKMAFFVFRRHLILVGHKLME